MAGFNYDVVRVTMFGDTFGGQEEWTTGFWLGDAAEPAVEPTDAQAEAIAVLWKTYFQTVNAQIRTGVRTLGVKMSFYPSGQDKVDPDLTRFHHYTTPALGGKGGSQTFPPQIALVASLEAAPSAGLAGKGRMFLPGVEIPIEADGTISAANRLAAIGPLKIFFDGVNSSESIPGFVINASKGRIGVPYAPPVNRRVANIRIGSVYDTQRRRRNQLAEQYTGVALA